MGLQILICNLTDITYELKIIICLYNELFIYAKKLNLSHDDWFFLNKENMLNYI